MLVENFDRFYQITQQLLGGLLHHLRHCGDARSDTSHRNWKSGKFKLTRGSVFKTWSISLSHLTEHFFFKICRAFSQTFCELHYKFVIGACEVFKASQKTLSVPLKSLHSIQLIPKVLLECEQLSVAHFVSAECAAGPLLSRYVARNAVLVFIPRIGQKLLFW